jgi:hypothetical protein
MCVRVGAWGREREGVRKWRREGKGERKRVGEKNREGKNDIDT